MNWISVDTELPTVFEYGYSGSVLVSDGIVVGLGALYRDEDEEFWTSSYYVGVEIDYTNILHWMPLPEPPKD